MYDHTSCRSSASGSRQVASNAWVAICTPIVFLFQDVQVPPGFVSAPPFDATITISPPTLP